MKDSHLYSLLKALSWRLLGTLVTVLLVFVFTSEWGTSFYIGFFEMLGKIGLFYLHERLWVRIKNADIKNLA